MTTHQFQTDRSEALRRQLVQMPLLLETDTAPQYDGDQVTASTRPPQREGVGRSQRRAGRPARTRRALVAIGVPVVAILVAGQVSMTAQSAYATGLLRSIADDIATFVDPAPGPGQYLLIHQESDGLGIASMTEDGVNETFSVRQRIDVYVPHDPADDWVLDRELSLTEPLTGHTEILRAQNGEFYGTPWSGWLESDVQALPRDGQALLDHFDARYLGGSNSRDEDNFVRITDLLRSGLVPADVRAGLLEALALIPGVDAKEQQTNLNGQMGIAIGRSEPLRFDQRHEILIDPETGLVIGERFVNAWEVFGFGLPGEITWQLAIEYRIVDSAPEPAGPVE